MTQILANQWYDIPLIKGVARVIGKTIKVYDQAYDDPIFGYVEPNTVWLVLGWTEVVGATDLNYPWWEYRDIAVDTIVAGRPITKLEVLVATGYDPDSSEDPEVFS